MVSLDHTHLLILDDIDQNKMSARNAVEMSPGFEIRVRHKINVSKYMM